MEIPLGNRFSVATTGASAHWHSGNNYTLQTLQGGLDLKYWFDRKKGRLTGWSGGVYAVYGAPWDVQWRDGWQGNRFFSAGLSAGYSTPIGKRLNLEFLLGAGWFHTPEARHYHRPEQGHLMWQQTRRNVDRFSLTRAQVNIVWILGADKSTDR